MMYGGGSVMHGGGHVVRGFGHGFMTFGQSGWMGWVALALHLLFFVAVIVLGIVFMRRHAKKVRLHRKLNDPALLILRERYALGEIETEEFLRRKHDLAI